MRFRSFSFFLFSLPKNELGLFHRRCRTSNRLLRRGGGYRIAINSLQIPPIRSKPWLIAKKKKLYRRNAALSARHQSRPRPIPPPPPSPPRALSLQFIFQFSPRRHCAQCKPKPTKRCVSFQPDLRKLGFWTRNKNAQGLDFILANRGGGWGGEVQGRGTAQRLATPGRCCS